jgi:hypothetical protein
MKNATSLLALALFVPIISLNADSLRFTGGVVGTNFSTVVLSIAGPTNLVCQIERLNPANDSWESQGNVNLGASGSANFTNSLIDGIYGFYRTKATNNTVLCTNAFGAVCGYLEPGDSFIGNIFGATSISSIIPHPTVDIEALKYVNGSGWTIADYSGGAWTGDFSVGTLEGVYIKGITSEQRYVVSGLFDTNTLTKSFPSGLSTVCLPLYHVDSSGTWVVDSFDTAHVGGNSGLPVQSAGFNPQCTLYQLANSSGLYRTNLLTSTNVWQNMGTNQVLHFKITEGFFIDKPTNANWSVNRSIW